MGSTVHNDDEVSFDNYTDGNIGNGDPVVVVPLIDGRAGEPLLLGTGFEAFEDLVRQLEHAAETGEPTQDIPYDAARKMGYTDTAKFDIFIPGARADVNPAPDHD